MLRRLISASLLCLVGTAAQAAPIAFDFATTVDARGVGGGASEAISFRFETDTDAAPSGEFRYLTIFGTGVAYEGTLTTVFGGRTVTGAGRLSVVNDDTDPAARTADPDAYGDRLYFASRDGVAGAAIFDGFSPDNYSFGLVDTSASLFDDGSLPTNVSAGDFDRLAVYVGPPYRSSDRRRVSFASASPDFLLDTTVGTVPEPSTLALLGLGAFAVGAGRRRTRPHAAAGQSLGKKSPSMASPFR